MKNDASLRAIDRNVTVMHMSKPEEGSAKGEGWVVFRAVVVLVGGILALGYLIA